MTRRCALILALMFVTPAHAEATCSVSVAAVGRACPVDGGFEMDLGGGLQLFTHGADPALTSLASATPPAPAAVSCVGDPSFEPHGLAVYYRMPNAPDGGNARIAEIQTLIETANGKLLEEAGSFGLDIRFRMACTAGRPTVVRVSGSKPRASTTFDTIINDLRARGYADTHQKYWIWVEGPQRGLGGAAGIGTLRDNDTDAAWNGNNFGPSYSATFGYSLAEGGWAVMLHEASHTLGAVQTSAPSSNGRFHCNDGLDIMCYPEGSSPYTETRCATGFRYDCGNDDYFNPRPSPTAYLARSWNIGAPVNRYVAGCAYGAAHVTPLAPLTVDVSACVGARYSAAGFLPPRDLSAVQAPINDPADPPIVDADVCFYAGAVLLSCAVSAIAPEAGAIPTGATRAVVDGGTTPITDVVFSAI